MNFKLITILVLSQCLAGLCDSSAYAGWSKIQMNHSLNCKGGRKFCHRGNIFVKSIKTGFVMEQKNFTNEDLQKLIQLADKDGFYSIRTRLIMSTNGPKGNTFLSSMKARDLLRSGLRDHIYIWLQLCGHPMAVTFASINQEKPLNKLKNDEYKIVSIVTLKMSTVAPEPDIAPYKQQLKNENERKAGEDDQGFFEKYWLYFAVFIFFCFASGATSEDD